MSTTYPAGYHTRRELLSQPEVWAAAVAQLDGRADEVARFLARGQYTHVVFTGCGSPYYSSVWAALVWQGMTGVPALPARPPKSGCRPTISHGCRGGGCW